MCPFQNSSSTSGIFDKSTVSAKFSCEGLCRESESYWERLSNLMWFPEVVDGQISGVSWRLWYKNIMSKHKNALRVFSWSNFVLDNRLWGQERWFCRSVLVGRLAVGLIVWETKSHYFCTFKYVVHFVTNLWLLPRATFGMLPAINLSVLSPN